MPKAFTYATHGKKYWEWAAYRQKSEYPALLSLTRNLMPQQRTAARRLIAADGGNWNKPSRSDLAA